MPAVDRAARILNLIQAGARPMSITELAAELGASKGTVREILETLRHHGLLERNEESKRYRLGPELMRLGVASREDRNFGALARPHLRALSDRLKENVLLLAVQEQALLIQEACEPRDPRAMVLVSATPGRSIPMHAGACAKAILVWGDESAHGHARPPGEHRANLSKAELDRTRSRGYAIDDQEFLEGVRGVVAPIFGSAGKLEALILISGIAASLPRSRLKEVGEAARSVAATLSALLRVGGSA